MKPVGPTLKEEIEKRGLVKARIAEEFGVAPTNFTTIMKCKSMDLSKYVRLCNIIGCSPLIVFDDELAHGISIGSITQSTGIGDANVNVNEGVLKMLGQLLESKERTIHDLENRIKDKEVMIAMLSQMIDPEKLVGLGI